MREPNGNIPSDFGPNVYFNKFILLLLIFSTITNGCISSERERLKRGVSRISCKASLTTIMISAGCPSDSSTLGERKRALSCQTVHQNCTEPANFRYHCVLNEYANQSIEVCAVATSIIGNVCAEFNKGGEFVQEHYTTPVNCSRCPFMYASSDAHQYQECYTNVKNDSSTSSSSKESVIEITQSTPFTSIISPLPDLDKTGTFWKILIVISVAIMIMIISAMVFFFIRIKKRHRNDHQEHQPSEAFALCNKNE
ncbi:uncharacterized protein LOC130052802 [Ostrea edulis]|uniref:uncharacterized protein LOC130052802 n=1 Tax=Ostrea edulis TaxID=37623 RepID=UPI0024AFFD96|nr:uncharacterized protein LOC130052802 [Ostrea edulis]XP_056014804.1 uncharacterized protein LOC130052802 [Ostrea edulis]XP_056014805.1 uncharacterized protein LOC130052802 [Ostrea edulis]XP_056014806.1 uncharacterized protein LOC130052802 [Ostrea edulis]XP_056014807.1 uncharacterized protein LOC130052802 [Ostrea edulis]XP_056014808.1 uncharacterized protein LOC130052802 [Ostrea edulis]XP_056014809.1 uncharacterized protein LOC130052802 [Ostrea edulis]XP_056014810.1 uncharacterized protein 